MKISPVCTGKHQNMKLRLQSQPTFGSSHSQSGLQRLTVRTLIQRKPCRLTIRSTGPIAACRHLGYKSLAQMPAHRNGPVNSNVRPHQRHAYSLPVNPRRSCGTHNNTPCTSDVSSGIFIFYALSIHFKRLESIVKLCFRRGLTTRSTGHFAACQVWAKIRAQTRHAAKCRLTFTLGPTKDMLTVCP